jgi:hypothetical protein
MEIIARSIEKINNSIAIATRTSSIIPIEKEMNVKRLMINIQTSSSLHINVFQRL